MGIEESSAARAGNGAGLLTGVVVDHWLDSVSSSTHSGFRAVESSVARWHRVKGRARGCGAVQQWNPVEELQSRPASSLARDSRVK